MENQEDNKDILDKSNEVKNLEKNGVSHIAGAIIIAGILIAGAILLKDAKPPVKESGEISKETYSELPPVNEQDRVLGNQSAKVTIIEYADFQCPFCERFYREVKSTVINEYINQGKVRLVYRDFAFLGEESLRAAEAAWCANEQGKFWEYHNSLFLKQNGENKRTFSDQNLKTFAGELKLDINLFDKCFNSNRYLDTINESRILGAKAGVRGTPKGFILVNNKVVETIDGAESANEVRTKIEQALR